MFQLVNIHDPVNFQSRLLRKLYLHNVSAPRDFLTPPGSLGDPSFLSDMMLVGLYGEFSPHAEMHRRTRDQMRKVHHSALWYLAERLTRSSHHIVGPGLKLSVSLVGCSPQHKHLWREGCIRAPVCSLRIQFSKGSAVQVMAALRVNGGWLLTGFNWWLEAGVVVGWHVEVVILL